MKNQNLKKGTFATFSWKLDFSQALSHYFNYWPLASCHFSTQLRGRISHNFMTVPHHWTCCISKRKNFKHNCNIIRNVALTLNMPTSIKHKRCKKTTPTRMIKAFYFEMFFTLTFSSKLILKLILYTDTACFPQTLF